MELFKSQKVVLKFENALSFLNGLTCNSLDAKKNAFLDGAGRIIAACDQLHVGGIVYMAMMPDAAEALKEHLQKYLAISEAKLINTDFIVYYLISGEHESAIDYDNYKIIFTTEELASLSEEEYTKFRLDNFIPLQGIDYQKELVLNVDYDYVSFDKGCYLGQEVVARVHNLAKPPKRLSVDQINDENKNKITSINQGRGFVFLK